jgi:hypothetical protein
LKRKFIQTFNLSKPHGWVSIKSIECIEITPYGEKDFNSLFYVLGKTGKSGIANYQLSKICKTIEEAEEAMKHLMKIIHEDNRCQ